jgi:hypothetical protein
LVPFLAAFFVPFLADFFLATLRPPNKVGGGPKDRWLRRSRSHFRSRSYPQQQVTSISHRALPSELSIRFVSLKQRAFLAERMLSICTHSSKYCNTFLNCLKKNGTKCALRFATRAIANARRCSPSRDANTPLRKVVSHHRVLAITGAQRASRGVRAV